MFVDPTKIIEQLNVTPGMVVADLGAGSGFYTLAVARKLKQGGITEKEGKVYAIEVQRDLLARIKDLASKENLTNIDYLWANFEKLGGTKLHDHSVDRVILSNVLFQLEDHEGSAKEISRILKQDGKLLLIDWSDSFGGMGPTPETMFPHIKAVELFAKYGFHVESDVDAGAHHYGIIFSR